MYINELLLIPGTGALLHVLSQNIYKKQSKVGTLMRIYWVRCIKELMRFKK